MIIVNTFLTIYLLLSKKNFFSKIIVLFFSIYYILPPLMYLIFVNEYLYININNSILFIKESIIDGSLLILNLLTFIYLLFFLILPNKSKIFRIKKRIELKKLSFLYIILFFILLYTNYLYFQQAGGVIAFFNSHWAERFGKTGLLFTIILNIKILIPFALIFISALLFDDSKLSKYFKIFIQLTLFIAFVSFIIGGSGRKFAVLFIFAIFIIQIEIFSKKKYNYYFWISLIAIFLISQILMFLRTAGFDFNRIDRIFSEDFFQVFENLIMASEPLGTYSISLQAISAINNNILEQGYFYEFSKLFLFPLEKIGLLHIQNIAFSLGQWHNPTLSGFTLFPTIIVEGYYHLSFIGSVIFGLIYVLIAKITIDNIYYSNNLYSFLFKYMFFLLFIIQMIRGYFTISVGYLYMTILLLFIIFIVNIILKIIFKNKKG
jgi:hypothetical protein